MKNSTVRIIGNRATGKTYALLKAASETGGNIVCSNPRALKQKAKDYGFDMSKCTFMSYGEFDYCHAGKEPVWIDEIEMFFKGITGLSLGGYTLSIENSLITLVDTDF